MNHMKKVFKHTTKFLALLVTITMLMAVFPAVAMAAPGPCTCDGTPNNTWLPKDYCASCQANLKADLREIIAEGAIVGVFDGMAKGILNNAVTKAIFTGIIRTVLDNQITVALAGPQITDIVNDYVYNAVLDEARKMLASIDQLGDDSEIVKNLIATMLTEKITEDIAARIVDDQLIRDIIDQSIANVLEQLSDDILAPILDVIFDALVDGYVEEIWNNGDPTTGITGHWALIMQSWNKAGIAITMTAKLTVDFFGGLFNGKLAGFVEDAGGFEAIVAVSLDFDYVWDIIAQTAKQLTQSRIDADGKLNGMIVDEMSKIWLDYDSTGTKCQISNHRWQTVTILPTCIKTGGKTNICLVCMERRVLEVYLPTGHKEVTTTVRPTCEHDGSISTVCSTCNSNIRGFALPMLANCNMSNPEDIDPTCEDVGYIGFSQCFDCGRAEYEEELAVLGHDLDDGEVVIAATCTEEGEMLFLCQREGCNHFEIESFGPEPCGEADCRDCNPITPCEECDGTNFCISCGKCIDCDECVCNTHRGVNECEGVLCFNCGKCVECGDCECDRHVCGGIVCSDCDKCAICGCDCVFFLLGDVDGNGRITPNDITMLLQHYQEIIVLTPAQLLRGDIDGNGRISPNDITSLLQYYQELTDGYGYVRVPKAYIE